MKYQTLPGFREFYPEQCAERNFIFRLWRQCAQRFAFSEYDGPVLEPLELLTAKSGDEIVSQLFCFEDKGGRAVTLRPELTPTLARMVGAKAGSLKRPIRWFSIGENYRYERQQKGRLRAFYQFNADILGEAGPMADAELIGLLIETFVAFGLGPTEFTVRLSDRNLWLVLLERLGLSETQRVAVLGVVDKIERTPPEKTAAALDAIAAGKGEFLRGKIEGFLGLKDFDAIRAYLLSISPEVPLDEKMEETLARWPQLLSLLDAAGLSDFLTIDLKVVRGLAYYTGFVFEAFQTVGQGRALAGGGRYDQLVEKLGGPSMPAVGFGMGDVTLGDLLDQLGRRPQMIEKRDAFVIYAGEGTQAAALDVLYRLRRYGARAEMPFAPAGIGKQFKQAAASGARFTVIIGENELAEGMATVRDMNNSQEEKIPLRQAAEYVAAALREG